MLREQQVREVQPGPEEPQRRGLAGLPGLREQQVRAEWPGPEELQRREPQAPHHREPPEPPVRPVRRE